MSDTKPDVANGQYYDVDTPVAEFDFDTNCATISCNSVIEKLRMSYHHASAFAYLWRAGNKPNTPAVDDMKKAVWHLQHEIELLEG